MQLNQGISGQSSRRYLIAGFLLFFLLIGGGVTWSALTNIAGAVIASGQVDVESNVKTVQHKEGGIVSEIHVQNGDKVAAGELLVRLDNTLAKANLVVISKQLDEFHLEEARLVAEIEGHQTIKFPESLKDRSRDATLQVIIKSQQRLLTVRQANITSRKQQLNEQITQIEKQIEGLDAQRIAKSEEIALINSELADLEKLLSRGLVPRTRVNTLKRKRAELSGEEGDFVARIAQSRTSISERQIQILQIDEEVRSQALQRLQEVRAEIASLTEQKITAKDQARRVDIRAPRAGIVHQLNAHTKGGVINPGEAIMQIVPGTDQLVFNVRLRPVDIDQVYPSQSAKIQLSAFDQKNTPQLKANIQWVSPDLQQDPKSGASYYLVRLLLADGQIEKLQARKLIPGMPVEAFIKTKERTVLSYILKPFLDQARRAMRES